MDSKDGFPKLSRSQQTGSAGVTIVQRLVESKLKWRFRRNHQEDDFGIDGYIDVVSDSGQVVGKMLAVQIKTGSTYLDTSHSKQLLFKGDLKHLNYFLNTPIPVLVVVVDEKRGSAYWAQVHPGKIRLREKCWILSIPKKQRLDASAKRKILRLVGLVHYFIPTVEYFETLRQMISSMSGVLFLITKSEILNTDVSRLKQFIEMFHADCESLESIRNKLSLGVHGYENDSRELYEIPEVRRWFKHAEQEVLGWPFYLMTEPDGAAIKVFLFCTSELTPVGEWNGKTLRKVWIDGKEVGAFLERHFISLNNFAVEHSLSMKQLENVSEAFGECVLSMMIEE